MSKRARIDEDADARISRKPESIADRPRPTRSKPARKTFYLTEDLVRRINELAARRGVSASDIVKLGMDDYLREQGVR